MSALIRDSFCRRWLQTLSKGQASHELSVSGSTGPLWILPTTPKSREHDHDEQSLDWITGGTTCAHTDEELGPSTGNQRLEELEGLAFQR